MLVSPKYPGLIYDYKVDLVDLSAFNTVQIDVGVIVYPEKYYELESYDENPFNGLDSHVHDDVRDALKYLGNNRPNVSLYVLED